MLGILVSQSREVFDVPEVGNFFFRTLGIYIFPNLGKCSMFRILGIWCLGNDEFPSIFPIQETNSFLVVYRVVVNTTN